MKKKIKLEFGKIDEALYSSKKELNKAKERTRKLIDYIKEKQKEENENND